jgi:small subunit ribosomal protein S21
MAFAIGLYANGQRVCRDALDAGVSQCVAFRNIEGGGSFLPLAYNTRRECFLQVIVRDNNVDQALRVLKKKMQREGVFREMKRRRFYEKPSEKATREQGEAIRRARKAARKKAQREGLLPAPKPRKVLPGRAPPRSA